LDNRKFEIFAVLLTGLAKFLVVDYLEAKFWFILLTGMFWISYITIKIIHNSNVIKDWGLGFDGFRSSLKLIIIPAVAVTLLSIWYGQNEGVLVFNWHIIPVMILYPLWGTIQQFLIISLFGGNLIRLPNPRLSKSMIVGLTSGLFSIVHYPSIPLMAVTFFLAVYYTYIFFRFKNLLALGLFHGWLACIFYFFVLGQDPWVDFIRTI